MRNLLWLGVLLLALLSACAAPSQPATSATGAPVVTVFRSPT